MLGSDVCAALPCFHALTGCDSTSGLFGIGKKKAWATLKRNIPLHPGISKLGDELPLTAETSKACEIFVCSLYTSTKMSETSADQLRYWMFVKTNRKASPCHQLQTAFTITLKEEIIKHLYGRILCRPYKPYHPLLVTDGSYEMSIWKFC